MTKTPVSVPRVPSVSHLEWADTQRVTCPRVPNPLRGHGTRDTLLAPLILMSRSDPETAGDTLRSTLTLVIPGRPASWQRPVGRRRHTDPRVRVAQQRIRIVAREALPEGWARTGSFGLVVAARFVRGSSLADCDNLAKLVGDALEGLVYDNDRQVVELRALKEYGAERDETVVHVERIG